VLTTSPLAGSVNVSPIVHTLTLFTPLESLAEAEMIACPGLAASLAPVPPASTSVDWSRFVSGSTALTVSLTTGGVVSPRLVGSTRPLLQAASVAPAIRTAAGMGRMDLSWLLLGSHPTTQLKDALKIEDTASIVGVQG